jgi:hypothetical protein
VSRSGSSGSEAAPAQDSASARTPSRVGVLAIVQRSARSSASFALAALSLSALMAARARPDRILNLAWYSSRALVRASTICFAVGSWTCARKRIF